MMESSQSQLGLLEAVGSSTTPTPVMRQYAEAKRAYPDALLFFRMGDFYELFHEDAEIGSRVLGITLTSRGKSRDGSDIPMAGVPVHAASGYIQKLVEQGHRVAVCEQMALPSEVKGIVPRQVVRVVTPALQLETEQSQDVRGQWLVAVAFDGQKGAVAGFECAQSRLEVVDVSDVYSLWSELSKLDPREILWVAAPSSGGQGMAFEQALCKTFPRAAVRALRGAKGGTQTERVTEVLKQYIKEAFPLQKTLIDIEVIHKSQAQHMALDAAVFKSLEIFETSEGMQAGSLFASIDRTQSVLGKRLLVRWLSRPLKRVDLIAERHDAVQWMVDHPAVCESVRQAMRKVGDMERLMTRVCVGIAGARDYLALRSCLRGASEVFEALRPHALPALCEIPQDQCHDVLRLLEQQLKDGPFVAGQNTDVFQDAAHPELATLRNLANDSKTIIAQLEHEERIRTGITNLKVKFSRVFGYTIEVTKSQLHLVPSNYRRKQTIAQGERFVIDALDQLQEKIASAEARIQVLEAELLAALKASIVAAQGRIRHISQVVAVLDVITAFADLALRHHYCRPVVDDSWVLDLKGVRHPVIEGLLPAGAFVENDISLSAVISADNDAPDRFARTWIITGPNMAGKSTVMREAAIAILLAQTGSFVPAKKAHVGWVDRMFTRVGAQDRLTRGESTFMVEMSETATILHHATQRSFVILDEIGRGTSTYDGLALAWSIVERLHQSVQCRLLCATHYHELAALEAAHRGIENRNVAIDIQGGRLVFLYRLAQGPAQHSFGISVAQLAGLPQPVIQRASEVLKDLEKLNPSHRYCDPSQVERDDALGRLAHSVLGRLRSTDVEALRPIDALVVLSQLCDELKDHA